MSEILLHFSVITGATESSMVIETSLTPSCFSVRGVDRPSEYPIQDLPALLARFIELGPSIFDPEWSLVVEDSEELRRLITDEGLTLFRCMSLESDEEDLSFFVDQSSRWLLPWVDDEGRIELKPVASLQIWLLLCQIAESLYSCS